MTKFATIRICVKDYVLYMLYDIFIIAKKKETT
jgi:hypothetical protein